MVSLHGMESTFLQMNDKKAYSILLREIECLKNREHCSRQCSSCSWGNKVFETFEGLKYLQEILKARCPELYFAENLTQLEETLDVNVHKNKET